ncbi:MAG: SulP family inorganic anion transporter, partial [Actinomycetota bacterium]|nr:SulP family inorganic anion transporter [Actinomycetota bacterium]
VGLVAGFVLVGMSLIGLGRYVKFLPIPVIEGFTAGIAVVIALQQVPAALGVEPGQQERVWALAGEAIGDYLADPALVAPLFALGVTAFILLGSRWKPAWPVSLMAVVVATLLSRFVVDGLDPIGALPSGIPAPSLGFLDFGAVPSLATAILAVAALAALESLLSAAVADAMSVNERHDPDRELFGQGLANIASPIFGGIPATAAIARTAVNVRAGASSKLASFTHAIVLLLIILVASSLVSDIPLAALAGVLFATTIRMVEVGSLSALLRSTRGDAAVLLLTFFVTVAFDLVAAVVVGLGVAIVIALRSVARSAQIEQVPLATGDFSKEEQRLLREHIVAYRLDGPLFFGAAHRFLLELTEVADVRVVILRMGRVSTMDATGAQLLGDVITRMERRGIVVLLSGVSDEQDEVLAALGAVDHLRENGRIFAETLEAIRFARKVALA